MKRKKCKSIISKYVQINKFINKKKDLKNEEIHKFDKLVDESFEEIIDNFRIQMITNYIHMLGAGHISYFLRKYSIEMQFTNHTSSFSTRR